MDKPKCRLCGAKHLLTEAHEIQVSSSVKVKTKDERTARSLAARVRSERPARTAVSGSVPNKVAVERVKRWRAEHAEEYRTYMRNYMRARRRGEAP
jgi:hypothetical protein